MTLGVTAIVGFPRIVKNLKADNITFNLVIDWGTGGQILKKLKKEYEEKKREILTLTGPFEGKEDRGKQWIDYIARSNKCLAE